MVEEDHLFISVGANEYRKNKSNVLRSQANLLKMLKSSYNLRVLEGQKRDVKIQLASLVTSIRDLIEKVENEIPSPIVPTSLRKKDEIEEPEEPEKKAKKKKTETGHLDGELLKIQEKLRELNS